MRTFIAEVCQDGDIGEDLCHSLQLAVDEAATNVVEYGYEEMDPGSIIVDVYADSQRVIVTLTDFGHPFEPVERDRPDLSVDDADLPTHGFGLFFIYETMDEVDYQCHEDGNQLTLTKKLS
jgi:anti-sigma regulatory factor (Ser/Thr protein kinase)